MAEKHNQASAQGGNAVQDVDRVRDIIFGAQMRDYEQRFQALQRDLERVTQALDRLSEQLSEQDSDQNKKLQGLRRDMREADEDLRGELRQTSQQLTNDKVDRMVLAELFIDMGTHLKTGGSVADVLKSLIATE